MQEAIELAGITRHVTLVHASEAPTLADRDNIEVVAGRIAALHDDGGLSAVTLATPDGERTLPAAAVFAYTGRVPEVSLARALLDLDAAGHIMTDVDLRTCAVSVFACGDVRAGAPQCIAAAMQDGERAGHAAARHVKAARQTESAG
jgi:thioredoxin reductase